MKTYNIFTRAVDVPETNILLFHLLFKPCKFYCCSVVFCCFFPPLCSLSIALRFKQLMLESRLSACSLHPKKKKKSVTLFYTLCWHACSIKNVCKMSAKLDWPVWNTALGVTTLLWSLAPLPPVWFWMSYTFPNHLIYKQLMWLLLLH